MNLVQRKSNIIFIGAHNAPLYVIIKEGLCYLKDVKYIIGGIVLRDEKTR